LLLPFSAHPSGDAGDLSSQFIVYRSRTKALSYADSAVNQNCELRNF